jgi:hypothetical protein
MSRKVSSCLHGPRPGPVSSSRRSSSSIDNQESGDGSLRPHNHSKDMTWPMSTTSSLTSQSSFLFLSDGYGEPIDLSTSNVEKSQTRHVQQPEGRRPLPPIPQYTHRPSLSISISSSTNSTEQRRPRWLPVPPLPMAPFPTSEYRIVLLTVIRSLTFSHLVGPTACSSPETSLPPPMNYSPFDEEIDWCMVDEILATFSQ